MDATRPRRQRDYARQIWYARWRSVRFARHFGFSVAATVVQKPEIFIVEQFQLIKQIIFQLFEQ